MITRLAVRHMDATLKREASLVVDGAEAEMGLFRRAMGRLGLSLGFLGVAMWAPEPWESLAWPLLGWMLGSTAMISTNRAAAYRRGWLEGRSNMSATLRRTGDVRHAFEYDAVHVMGFAHPIVPDSPEGLEGQ